MDGFTFGCMEHAHRHRDVSFGGCSSDPMGFHTEPGSLLGLTLATCNNDVQVINILLNAGAEISLKDHNESSPMHLATSNGHVAAIKALKEAGADVAAQDKDGRTPMR
jgi:ankyrin repeat protein